MLFPEHLQKTIQSVHGARGAEWLAKLPETLAACERRFQINIHAPFPNLSYNLVLSAMNRDGEEIVVKMSVPNKELTSEINALRLHDGQGYVRLLDADPELGVMLLEKVQPGIPLSQVQDDEQAALIYAAVLKKQKRVHASPADFSSLADWAKGLERIPPGMMPAERVTKAQSLYRSLFETMTETTLLHGDLHHDNLLAVGKNDWVAIDPKGVIGDPCFEPIPFLLNYLTSREQLAKRIDIICGELGLEKKRVIAFGCAHMVLSAWWLIEDGMDGYESALQKADYFEELLESEVR